MAFQPRLLTQFQQFARDKGMPTDAPGLTRAAAQVDTLSDQDFSNLLGVMVPLLQNINENMSGGAQPAITQRLTDLAIRQGTVAQQKEWFKNVLLNKAIQECLIAQLQQHQQRSGLTDNDVRAMDKPEKHAFIQKGIEGLLHHTSESLHQIATREAYDPLGLFFSFFFEGLGMLFDGISNKILKDIGIPTFDSEEDTVTPKRFPTLDPTRDPTNPAYMAPPHF